MSRIHRCLLAIVVLAASLATAAAADQPYTIAVIPKGTTHEYWKCIHAGAIKAQRELQQSGVKLELFWKGPLREDDRDQQIQTVENFMTRRVSGIVLAPLDSSALATPVANAAKSGIPVLIFDSALKSDKYISFVATDNYLGGQLAAEKIGRLLGGHGNVILLRYAVGSASTEAREAGFVDTLQKKFPDLKLISSDQHAGPTQETAYQVSQNLLSRYGREVNAVFVPNETATIAMTKALRDIGQAGGKVKIIGFDAGPQSVTDMKNGDVQGLVVQDPVRMGYLSVITMVKHLQGEKIESRIDTGVHLITPENMDQPEMKDLLQPSLDKYLND
jgi:ribose transport system substrate-binding protein